jgi:hypothetical protein
MLLYYYRYPILVNFDNLSISIYFSLGLHVLPRERERAKKVLVLGVVMLLSRNLQPPEEVYARVG